MKNIAIVALALVATTNVNAQQSDSLITINESERALALAAYDNGECFESREAPDGVLTLRRHGGWEVGVAGNFTHHSLSNNDGVAGVGGRSAKGGDAMIGYRLVRKGWTVASLTQGYVGLNSSYECEGLKVGENLHFGVRELIELSHGAIRPALGGHLEYEKMVSQNREGDPYMGNAFTLGIDARLTATVGHIKTNKMAKVGNKKIMVRCERPINIFLNASYGFSKIGKTWSDADAAAKGYTKSPFLNDSKLRLEAGVSIGGLF